jgi:hypothetical protein
MNLSNVKSENERKVIDAFNNGRVDEEHYQKGYALYRFSAIKHIDYKNINDLEEACTETLTKLHFIDIRPERIFLYNGSLEIDWTPRAHQCIQSREEYLELALEFAKFIDQLGDRDIEVNSGSFFDDAYLVPSYEKHKIKYNPKFNRKCFNWNNEIEVIDITRMK